MSAAESQYLTINTTRFQSGLTIHANASTDRDTRCCFGDCQTRNQKIRGVVQSIGLLGGWVFLGICAFAPAEKKYPLAMIAGAFFMVGIALTACVAVRFLCKKDHGESVVEGTDYLA